MINKELFAGFCYGSALGVAGTVIGLGIAGEIPFIDHRTAMEQGARERNVELLELGCSDNKGITVKTWPLYSAEGKRVPAVKAVVYCNRAATN